MSIIDNVLVAIDDENQTKSSLEAIFPQEKTSILFSALGRLVSRGFVKKDGRGKEQIFSITEVGAIEVELNLNYLQNIIDNMKMHPVLISLSIPEKYKVERERLRLQLKDWGFALVKNGLLVGMTEDIKILQNRIDEIKDNASILLFSLIDLPQEIKQNLGEFWDAKKLKEYYTNWTTKTKKLSSDLSKDIDTRRIQAKAAVYELALITKKDPKILESKFSSMTGKTEALVVYKNIRKYCYR